mgnify:CR=1 FL=1|tara:strand:- start:463 stop:888 length:426 start_codon:yes stop_codon:yes gene_type:complete
MAKSMRNVIREQSKLVEERTMIVKAALDAGCYTRSSIMKATGLEKHELANLLASEKELAAEYLVKKKLMAVISADNIFDIINDPKHKDFFQASKYILQNYKSDIDESLEPMSGDMELTLPGANSDDVEDAVVIKFSTGRKD